MMSRQRKPIQLPLVGMIILCLLAIAYLIAGKKRSAKPGASTTIIKHQVDTSSDDSLKYWTADKMRHAKGADLPHVNAHDQEKKHPQRPPDKSNPRHA